MPGYVDAGFEAIHAIALKEFDTCVAYGPCHQGLAAMAQGLVGEHVTAVCAIVFAPLVRDNNAGRQTLRPLWGSRLDTADQRPLKTMPSMQRGR